MSLPTPRTGEAESDFISRCAGDDAMNSEYPDTDQRVAVCYSQWRREHPKGKSMSVKPNPSGIAHAKSLAKEGKIDHGPWNADDVERSAHNSTSFLGVNDSEPLDSVAHWKYPVVKGGRVNRKAVGSAAAYAEDAGEDEIHSAAEAIGKLCDERNDEGKTIAIVKLTKKTSYGDCTGPLGFPMPSKLAFEAESALKSQPRGIRELFHAKIRGMDGKDFVVAGYGRRAMVPKEMSFVDGEHADVSVVTSDSKDRDDDVMLPRGANWDHFRKNPVVPFAHDYTSLPVGRAQWVTMAKVGDGEGWKAKTQYTKRPADHPANAPWVPDNVWHFVKSGHLPGKSVGFIPQNMRDPDHDETDTRPDWKGARLIDKYLMLEYSPVPVPANQDALVEAVAKFHAGGEAIAPAFLDALGLIIPDSIKDRLPLNDDQLGGDGADRDTMPDCPKCMDNTKVERVDEYHEDGPPLYRCMQCGEHFHGDQEAPELEDGQGQPSQMSFIAPETLRRAIERRAMEKLPTITTGVEKELADRLMRNLGTP